METRYCKNPECKKPIIDRRADAIYCSYKCSYTVRNYESRKYRISLPESKNLIAYKRLNQLIKDGINQMPFSEFKKLKIEIKNISNSIDNKGRLNFKLFDLYIQLYNGVVKFNTKIY